MREGIFSGSEDILETDRDWISVLCVRSGLFYSTQLVNTTPNVLHLCLRETRKCQAKGRKKDTLMALSSSTRQGREVGLEVGLGVGEQWVESGRSRERN